MGALAFLPILAFLMGVLAFFPRFFPTRFSRFFHLAFSSALDLSGFVGV